MWLVSSVASCKIYSLYLGYWIPEFVQGLGAVVHMYSFVSKIRCLLDSLGIQLTDTVSSFFEGCKFYAKQHDVVSKQLFHTAALCSYTLTFKLPFLNKQEFSESCMVLNPFP